MFNGFLVPLAKRSENSRKIDYDVFSFDSFDLGSLVELAKCPGILRVLVDFDSGHYSCMPLGKWLESFLMDLASTCEMDFKNLEEILENARKDSVSG